MLEMKKIVGIYNGGHTDFIVMFEGGGYKKMNREDLILYINALVDEKKKPVIYLPIENYPQK